MNLRIASVCLVASVAGCALRAVPPPATPAGYEHVSLRDVDALGLDRRNVEVVGSLGPSVSYDACGGVLTYRLQDAAIGAVFLGGTNLGAAMTAMASGGSMTITIPRARYAEVRNLSAFQRVRVRGYLSHFISKGCAPLWLDPGHYLWVDSIESQ